MKRKIFLKLKEIKKKLYEKEKNHSKLEEEEIEQYLTELERSINKSEKYHDDDDDDFNYKGIRDTGISFGDADEEKYYKPIKIYRAFKGNYKKYKNRGNRNKSLSVKQYLYMIIPYLHDMINDNKATMKLNNNKTQLGKWKIQLCMHINFVSSKDTEETRIIYLW